MDARHWLQNSCCSGIQTYKKEKKQARRRHFRFLFSIHQLEYTTCTYSCTCYMLSKNKSVGKTDCKPRKPDQVTVSAISLKWYIQTSTKSPSFISLIIPAKIWESLLSLYKSNRSRRQTLVPPQGNKIILKFSNVTYSSSLFVAWLKTKILFNEILNCWSFFFHHHFNALLK